MGPPALGSDLLCKLQGQKGEGLKPPATYPGLSLLLLGPHVILNNELDASLGTEHFLQVLLQVWRLGLWREVRVSAGGPLGRQAV